MKLYRDQRKVAVAESFNGAIIETDVRQFEIGLVQGVGLHHEAVILTGDQDSTCVEDPHRMIGTPMSKRQFSRRGTTGQRENLMASANPAKRHLPQQLLCFTDYHPAGRRITRPVA